MRPKVAKACLLCLAACSAFSAAATADDAAAPPVQPLLYRFTWTRGEGADGCPSERELSERVQARLGRTPFFDAATRVIEGVATQDGGTWRAELRVRSGDGALVGRRDIETRGEDCKGLAAAATLAVVLTVDPNASLVADETPTASFPLSSPPPSSPRPVSPAPRDEGRTARAPLARPVTAERGSGYFSALAIGGVGLLPRASLGVELDAHAPLSALEILVGVRILPAVATSGEHLEFGLASGSAGLCGKSELGSLRLSFCGALEGGAVTAVVRDLRPIDPGSYPWFALAAGPRLGWSASRAFGLELGLSAVIPLVRPRFRVQGAPEPAFEAAAVGGLLSLSVRVGTS